MTDEPKLYTQQEMDDVLDIKNAAIVKMQERIEKLEARFTRADVRGLEFQRDAARALADQLAKAATDYSSYSDTRPITISNNFIAALQAHDARDWKPAISPPGSGLDGLQADIDRTEA